MVTKSKTFVLEPKLACPVATSTIARMSLHIEGPLEYLELTVGPKNFMCVLKP